MVIETAEAGLEQAKETFHDSSKWERYRVRVASFDRLKRYLSHSSLLPPTSSLPRNSPCTTPNYDSTCGKWRRVDSQLPPPTTLHSATNVAPTPTSTRRRESRVDAVLPYIRYRTGHKRERDEMMFQPNTYKNKYQGAVAFIHFGSTLAARFARCVPPTSHSTPFYNFGEPSFSPLPSLLLSFSSHLCNPKPIIDSLVPSSHLLCTNMRGWVLSSRSQQILGNFPGCGTQFSTYPFTVDMQDFIGLKEAPRDNENSTYEFMEALFRRNPDLIPFSGTDFVKVRSCQL